MVVLQTDFGPDDCVNIMGYMWSQIPPPPPNCLQSEGTYHPITWTPLPYLEDL